MGPGHGGDGVTMAQGCPPASSQDGLAGRSAAGQIGDDDAVSALLAVNERDVSHLTTPPATLAIARATPGESVRWRGTMIRPNAARPLEAPPPPFRRPPMRYPREGLVHRTPHSSPQLAAVRFIDLILLAR